MLVEQKEAAVSRGLLEVESWVFQSRGARSSRLWSWFLGGAMGLWAIGLALMEGGRGWGVSWPWWDALEEGQQAWAMGIFWWLWSMSVGGALLHRLFAVRAERSLVGLLEAPGSWVRMQSNGKDFPTQAAICERMERVFSVPTQQAGGWLWAERGRLASIGELWLLGGVVTAILGAWVQPFAPTIPLWGRAILLAAPWVAMGAFLMIEQPSRQMAVWREGETLLIKVVCERDALCASLDTMALVRELQGLKEQEGALVLAEAPTSAQPLSRSFGWSALGPLLALGLTGVFFWREGAFASLDGFLRSLSTPMSVGWWGMGMGLMVGVLWAARRASSPVLGGVSWLGGVLGLGMAWLTYLPAKSVQKVLIGHEIFALVLWGLGLGLLLASALLAVRGGLFSENTEQADLYVAQQSGMIALVLLGGAFLAAVFWGWQADLLQRMGRVFVVFALTSVVWMPLRSSDARTQRLSSAVFSMGWVLWSLFVAVSVLSWMLLWMIAVV
jgi:hypothetical protein